MREAAVMLIINPDGYILGVSRRNDPNKFGLPGGKMDPGEHPYETAVRETLEETSIEVKAGTFLYQREEPPATPDGLTFYTHCFYAKAWTGEPQNSEEGIVKWLTSDDLTSDKGAFPEYNTQTLKVFKEKFPNINIK